MYKKIQTCIFYFFTRFRILIPCFVNLWLRKDFKWAKSHLQILHCTLRLGKISKYTSAVCADATSELLCRPLISPLSTLLPFAKPSPIIPLQFQLFSSPIRYPVWLFSSSIRHPVWEYSTSGLGANPQRNFLTINHGYEWTYVHTIAQLFFLRLETDTKSHISVSTLKYLSSLFEHLYHDREKTPFSIILHCIQSTSVVTSKTRDVISEWHWLSQVFSAGCYNFFSGEILASISAY